MSSVALSNPCFELWLLLHFADFPAEKMLTCNQVADRLRAAAGGYDKTKVYNLQIDDEKVSAAVKRAADKHPSLEEIPNAATDRSPPHHPVPDRQEDHLGPSHPRQSCRGGKEGAEEGEEVSRRCYPWWRRITRAMPDNFGQHGLHGMKDGAFVDGAVHIQTQPNCRLPKSSPMAYTNREREHAR